MMKQAIEKMRALIKQDAAQARLLTKEIQQMPRLPENGPARDSLWIRKRGGRQDRRYRLLAYGMLRGISYQRIESKCVAAPHEYRIYLAIRSVVADIAMAQFSRERIESWLLGREVGALAA